LNSGSYAEVIGNSGNLPLLFVTSGTEAMRINSSQQVGIGTNNPVDKLHVFDTVGEVSTFESTTTEVSLRLKNSTAGNVYLFNKDSNNFAIRCGGVAGSETLRVTSTSVGIGTTNPVGQLQVSSGPVIIGAATSTGTSGQVLQITGGAYISGNLGIGVTIPAAQFHVGGTASNNNAWAVFDVSDSYFKRIHLSEDRSAYGVGGYGAYLGYDGNLNTLTLGVYDNSVENRALNIKRETGNIGIGTVSPLTKLDVRGTITAGADATSGSEIIRGYYSGGGSLNVIGSEYSSGGAVIGYAVKPSTSASSAFFSSTGISVSRGAYTIAGNEHRWYVGAVQTVTENSSVTMSEVMRINASGNLGIGTNNPSEKLDVRGSISAAGRNLNVPHIIVKNSSGDVTYFEYYFNIIKNTLAGTATQRNILSVGSLSNFHQAAFTVQYGTRIQGVSDSTVSACLKQFGVNKFNSGSVAITDTNDIASDTNSNTHANVTCVTNGASAYIIRGEFSSTADASSFISGVLRGWGVSDSFNSGGGATATLTFSNGPT